MMDKLAERDEEEKTFARVFSECAAGRSRVVAIGGPLASGKTALLCSFARDAADAGATVLEATASGFERHHPLGIVDQLLSGRRLASPAAEREVRTLLANVCDSVPRADDTGNLRQISWSDLNLLHSAFQYLSGECPLVICIDDAHFMDIESLQYLPALMRRTGNAPILVVLTYCPDMGGESFQRAFQAEMLRMSNCVQLSLKPLSVTGVATILEEYLSIEAARGIAADCRDMSGGKPLLVHALAEDCTAAARTGEPGTRPAGQARPAAGPAFGEAVLSCLYRSEPGVLGLAQAIAVLEAYEAPSFVARFCGMAPESVGQVMASAGLGGLLDGDFLRQPSVRKAVLGSIAPGVRQAMHSRAARLLHDEGAPAPVVAEHLMPIDEKAPWANKVLREAADQALVTGNQDAAIGYLKKANATCANAREQAEISAKLAEVIWQQNPCAAKRYLPELVAAIESGYLDAQQSVQVITKLLWHGEGAQVARVLSLLRDGAHPEVTDYMAPYGDQLSLWLPLIYPGIAPGAQIDVDPANIAASTWVPEHRAAIALGAVLRGDPEVDAIRAAEMLLREARTGAGSAAASLASLTALIYSDRLDKASAWCDALLADAREQHGPVWAAMFTSARAAVHYRLGDLAGAEERGREALALMSPESWGTAVAVPLACLVLSLTAMGRHKDADCFVKFPVPRAAFETMGGLHYLSARGHLYLATGRYEAALRDFLACGDSMKHWDVDCPAAVPWRADAAQAYLGKGLVPQAKELIAEQLALLPSGQSRTHGLTYRTLAATLDLEERKPTLVRAVNILERCGDSLGLAYALTDLSHACMALGDHVQARAKAQKARALAEQCGAAPLRASLAAVLADCAPAESHAESPAERRRLARHLSKAELRVAELAAQGSTNEQIARKLFITVSTVEQHLTRVYRKLAIRRRTELSSRLPETVR